MFRIVLFVFSAKFWYITRDISSSVVREFSSINKDEQLNSDLVWQWQYNRYPNCKTVWGDPSIYGYEQQVNKSCIFPYTFQDLWNEDNDGFNGCQVRPQHTVLTCSFIQLYCSIMASVEQRLQRLEYQGNFIYYNIYMYLCVCVCVCVSMCKLNETSPQSLGYHGVFVERIVLQLILQP